MILNDQQLCDANANRDIFIDPFDEGQVQPASYDLRVGGQAITTSSDGVIDLKSKKFVVLNPGDFAILISYEKINLGPQYSGRFGLRSGMARSGLIATTGPQIDPGFDGRLIIGVTNLTPQSIPITYLDDFLTVEIHKLNQPCDKPYNGRYQNRLELTAEEISMITEKDSVPLVNLMESMSTVKRDTSRLKSDISRLSSGQKMIQWSIGISFTILSTIILVTNKLVSKYGIF